MKIVLNYNADSKGFELAVDMQADVVADAEAIGYIRNVLQEAAGRLSEFIATTNPIYHARIARGEEKSRDEQASENNPFYPFTSWIVKDEEQ